VAGLLQMVSESFTVLLKTSNLAIQLHPSMLLVAQPRVNCVQRLLSVKRLMFVWRLDLSTAGFFFHSSILLWLLLDTSVCCLQIESNLFTIHCVLLTHCSSFCCSHICVYYIENGTCCLQHQLKFVTEGKHFLVNCRHYFSYSTHSVFILPIFL